MTTSGSDGTTTDHELDEQRDGTGWPDLGLPVWAIIGLALLGVPRIVLHDLGHLEPGTPLNIALVLAPPLIWIVVVLARRVPNPFVTLVTIGAAYGVVLAVGHQILWNVSFGDNPPRLGDNLSGLAPWMQTVIIRGLATVSSFVTGTAVGAISGVIALALVSPFRRKSRSPVA